MKRKALALLLSVATIVNIFMPNILALESSNDLMLICEKTEHTHTDACYEVSETPTCGNELETHIHDDSCYTKKLICPLEEHIHTKECYKEVNENIKETVEPSHIEGCNDNCTIEGCKCQCHESSLFESLMACKTYDELNNMLGNLTDEEYNSFTSLELEQINTLYDSLVEPVPLPSYEYPQYLSVGPIIPYDYKKPIRSPRFNTSNLNVETGKTNTDGSITYHDNVTVDKTIEQVAGNNTEINSDNIYKLTMSAEVKSMIVDVTGGMDIILMLDMSNHMNSEGRVMALKTAVTNFINDVATRSPGSRIAIVRYAGNSEVMSGTQKAEDGALVTLSSGKNDLLAVVNGLSNPSGNSNSDLAMADAVRIFQSANENNQIDGLGTTYKNRTRVSILFTAGVPGNGSWDKEAKNAAQAAMSLSVLLKGVRFSTVTPPDNSNFDGSTNWAGLKGKYNVPYKGCDSTVYTVGLNLPEAQDMALIDTYNKLRSYADRDGNSWILKEESKRGLRVNEYLYRISSHRPTSVHYGYDDAKVNDPSFSNKYDNLKTVKWYRNSYNVRGLFYNSNMYFLYPDCITRNLNKGYFLTADDQNMEERLNEIFKQISVQTGKPIEHLTIRDYIDPSFVPCDINGNKLEVGTIIDNGSYKGTLKQDQQGRIYIEWLEVSLNPGDQNGKGKQTFNENIYVKPNDSLGGNNIPTNIPGISGVYPSQNNVYPFPEPTVDLPINYDVKGKEINIYLSNEIKASELVNININPNGINNAHINIEYLLKKADGTVVGRYVCNAGENQFTWIGVDNAHRPKNDESYIVSCTVTPIDKQVIEHNNTNKYHVHEDVVVKNIDTNAKVNVFKPELTFKDSHVWYGDTIKDFETENYIDSKFNWKHDTTLSETVHMEGKEPQLKRNYLYNKDLLMDGRVNTKYDIPIGVKVLRIDGTSEIDITNNVNFIHENCTPDCGWQGSHIHGNHAFMLHVNTCKLTITKVGGAQDEPYVFTVMKDGQKYSEITIVGNGSENIVELPVGNYSIVEDTNWSWRYNSNISGDVLLNSTNPNGEIKCTNTKTINEWLNGFSSVIKNIFSTKD